MTIGGIMAGGRGDRMAMSGGGKALVSVGDRPLIDWVLEQLADAQVSRVIVECRREDQGLRDHLNGRAGEGQQVDVVGAPSDMGSGSSLRALLGAAPGSDFLICTADTIAPAGALRRLEMAARLCEPAPEAALMVTTLVDDESPVWVREGGGYASDIGKGLSPTGLVFANARWLSASACDALADSPTSGSPESDTALMSKFLKTRRASVILHREEPVFDIDDPSDVIAAERWLSRDD